MMIHHVVRIVSHRDIIVLSFYGTSLSAGACFALHFAERREFPGVGVCLALRRTERVR